jgi:organic radical activating enzyme
VQIYFPGTSKLRVESLTDGGTTVARYYRPDSTLESQWTMTYTQLTVVDFDDTGKKVVSQSVYSKATSSSASVDGIEVDRTTWSIQQIIEKKSDGLDARVIHFTGGQPSCGILLAKIPARERTVDVSDNLPLPPSPYVDFY